MSDGVSYLNFAVMIFFVGIQSYYYFKVSPTTRLRLPVVVAITTFSMIITPMLMSSVNDEGDLFSMVGTPFIQLFFLLYQVLVFFFSMWEYKLVKSG